MSYRVIITDPAIDAIRAHAAYIAVHEELPETAAEWLDNVLDAADKLALLPRRYALAPEDAYRDYEVRWIAVGDFMLLFTVIDETNTVWVLNGRHAHQLPREDRLPGDPGN